MKLINKRPISLLHHAVLTKAPSATQQCKKWTKVSHCNNEQCGRSMCWMNRKLENDNQRHQCHTIWNGFGDRKKTNNDTVPVFRLKLCCFRFLFHTNPYVVIFPWHIASHQHICRFEHVNNLLNQAVISIAYGGKMIRIWISIRCHAPCQNDIYIIFACYALFIGISHFFAAPLSVSHRIRSISFLWKIERSNSDNFSSI